MGRRLALVPLLAACLVTAGAAGGADYGTRKDQVDARIGELQARIDSAKARERVLTGEIAAVTSKIRVLQGDVESAQAQLSELESVLALQQAKLDRLTELFRLQTRRLIFLQKQFAVAIERLNRRVVDIYTQDTPDAMSFVLSARNLADLVDQIEYLDDIGRQDEHIASEVREAKIQMRETRERTKATRKRVAATTKVVADRTAEQRAVRDRLVASRDQLAAARSLKRDALGTVREDKRAFIHEVEGLQAQSAALAARIQAAQAAAAAAAASSAPSTVQRSSSGSGFIWPVNGVLTSGFGWRWGRMHEGIDIACPSGTPVAAAAGGTVIYAGWMSGYGNLVVIDHGGGIATAYGHNTSVAVGVGQGVGQGQVIAYSGSTGHSTGPHLHFEVRVNGQAVDPLGYL
jgi:murein DD-endopeptidase MepM/ murein hydrolase activator NlpD